MIRKQQVIRALEHRSPNYLPLVYLNGNRSNSDILFVDVVDHFGGENGDQSEWGFSWKKTDATMGQPVSPVLGCRDGVSSLKVPDSSVPSRFAKVSPAISKFGTDRYYIASLALSGFTVMAALWGFSDLLMDLISGADGAVALADKVFEFEEQVIVGTEAQGFDAVAFFDDWGTQDGMIISPDLWRSFFKDRYRRQFALVHDLGMTVYFHSCGYYYEIIQDLIDIGVDFLNVSQPNLYDLRKLSVDFGDQVCFVIPVSYQTTSISGTRADIFEFVGKMIDTFDAKHGGLIGYLEEYESIGMSIENYGSCENAFRTLGAFPARA